VLAGALLLTFAATASAQGPSRGSVEISGGGVVVGGFDLDARTAQLTSNTGTTGGTFDFFKVDGKIETSYGLLARIGVFVTPAFSVEGGLRWTRPVNAQSITGDSENAPSITAEETLSQYVFEGSALWHFNAGGKAMPFVYGGAGYLRELHEGDALVEEGVEFHAGAGLKWWLGRKFGIRGEAGVSIRDGGFENDEKRRTVPVAAGSVIWVF
jgi:Outer membrane protein beta-barrel domain